MFIFVDNETIVESSEISAIIKKSPNYGIILLKNGNEVLVGGDGKLVTEKQASFNKKWDNIVEILKKVENRG